MTRPILTQRNYVTTRGKPQPDEWQAARDEWDLGDQMGHGATEAAAVADLLMQEELHAP